MEPPSEHPADPLSAFDAARLREVLGNHFLLYVLALNGEAALAEALETPTDQQRTLLESLTQLVDPAVIPDDSFGRQIELAHRFGMSLPEQTRSLANLLRETASGALPLLPVTDDPVLEGLFALLSSVYPVLLLPDAVIGPFGPQISSPEHNHPGKAQLEQAIQQDPVLTKLFTTHSESTGWTGSTLRANVGGSIQLWGFAGRQIVLAWQAAKLDSQIPAFDEVADRLIQQITQIRQAIQGKKVNVPVRVGLTGVLLPASLEELDLGWARVRRATALDRAVASRTGIEGKLQTTTADGETVTIEYGGDLVVELEMPYILLLEELRLEAGWPEELSELSQQLTDKLDSIRLGLVLGLDSPDPVNVVTTWQLILDPLANALHPAWSDPKRVPNLVPRQLTTEEVDNWGIWAKRVHKHRTPSVAVSVRRMLQAVGSRHSSDDVLVDAVIVWENLFGASQETTLRISSSLAWLLGTDASDRAERQKNYKRLYGVRSGIVHGSAKKVKPEILVTHSREAVLISIEALRAVFSTRTELLKLPTSEERSIAAMLDAKSPHS
jgi:hypothetical protein